MACYLITEIEILDRERMREYMAFVDRTRSQFGGRPLVRGGNPRLIEGEPAAERVVMTEFDSVDDAMRWLNSDEYRTGKLLRADAARARMLLVDGITATP